MGGVAAVVVCAQGAGAAARQEKNAAPVATQAAQTAPPAQRPPADPDKFAVILVGASGEEAYAKQFAQWAASLKGALVERLGFGEGNLKVLTENSADKGAARATAEEVRRAFESLRGVVKEESTVFVFFIGHGSFDGKQAKFNLVGPDLHAGEYRTLLGALAARRVVVVQMASASGEFVKALAGAGASSSPRRAAGRSRTRPASPSTSSRLCRSARRTPTRTVASP